MRMFSWPLALVFAALLLAGCANSPHTERPAISQNMAADWNTSPLAQGQKQRLHQAWWLEFNSATLTDLISQALSANPDVRIAAERIRQAEAQVQAANATLFPSLNLGAGSDKSWQEPSSGSSTSRANTTANLGISYELDLWGKLKAERQAATAGVAISKYDLASAQLTLTTGVANAWFQLLTLTERVKINEENLKIAQQNLTIVEAKYKYGAAAVSDVYRQRGVVNNQIASLLPLREQRRQTVSALAILLGQAPQGYQLAGEPLSDINLPTLDAGLPSQLLHRRPDLAAAEAQLRAADANLHAARAALLPTVSLTGSGGLASAALLSLANPSQTLALGASLSQSIFDGGRKRSQIKVSEARRRELIEQYRKSILQALKETEDALGNINLSQQQLAKQRDIVSDAERTLTIAEQRYQAGADELLSLLDAQRSLFSAQEQQANLRQSQLNATLDLIKALGGGWTQPNEQH
ncbi:efflux transporter outer membrane subunit [Oceanisphaera avium]|uniref:Protein CyaE n=1 Tax=Oceanisphaera avium TaxID=1903694 RepID=A0A1Y0CZI8_9GAMM|nr:efflux transporter outer membrane subunit [Oceanisphaera avium]ART80729.1 hypothetical protein CBP12_11680 [Oceanisphaera avium]